MFDWQAKTDLRKGLLRAIFYPECIKNLLFFTFNEQIQLFYIENVLFT